MQATRLLQLLLGAAIIATAAAFRAPVAARGLRHQH